MVIAVLRATDDAWSPKAKPLFDQLRRAAISVEANVVEGYALGSTAQFKRHLRIALGSAAEAECLIRCCTELSYLPASACAALEQLCGSTMRVLVGLLRKLMALTR